MSPPRNGGVPAKLKGTNGKQALAIKAMELEAKILTLRKKGLTYAAIGKEISIPTSTVATHMRRAFKRIQDEHRDEIEHARVLELTRLSALQEGIWEKATSGDTRAVRTVLAIMERRALILGLDAPTAVEITGNVEIQHVETMTDAQLAEVIAKSRELKKIQQQRVVDAAKPLLPGKTVPSKEEVAAEQTLEGLSDDELEELAKVKVGDPNARTDESPGEGDSRNFEERSGPSAGPDHRGGGAECAGESAGSFG